MADKRIKDLATTITAFRTGDVIPVDGPSGTAKMPYAKLIAVMANSSDNINAIHSITDSIESETNGNSVDTADTDFSLVAVAVPAFLKFNFEFKSGQTYTLTLSETPTSDINFFANTSDAMPMFKFDSSHDEVVFTPSQDYECLYVNFYATIKTYGLTISKDKNITARIDGIDAEISAMNLSAFGKDVLGGLLTKTATPKYFAYKFKSGVAYTLSVSDSVSIDINLYTNSSLVVPDVGTFNASTHSLKFTPAQDYDGLYWTSYYNGTSDLTITTRGSLDDSVHDLEFTDDAAIFYGDKVKLPSTIVRKYPDSRIKNDGSIASMSDCYVSDFIDLRQNKITDVCYSFYYSSPNSVGIAFYEEADASTFISAFGRPGTTISAGWYHVDEMPEVPPNARYFRISGRDDVFVGVECPLVKLIPAQTKTNEDNLAILKSRVDGMSHGTQLAAKAVILDTDFGGDIDDINALATLHWAERSGMVDIVGVALSVRREGTSATLGVPYNCVSAADAVCNYFGVADMCIGLDKQGFEQGSSYCGACMAYEHTLTGFSDALDAPEFYDRALKSLPENETCDLCIIGHLTGISRYMSNAANIALVNSKIRKMWIMGGGYPTGFKETNLSAGGASWAVNATMNVLNNYTGEIIFIGAEQSDIHCGDILYDDSLTWSMLYNAMHEYMQRAVNAGRYADIEEAWHALSSSLDVSAVLAMCDDNLALSGWNVVRGTNTLITTPGDDYGKNVFTPSPDGKHYYVTKQAGRTADWFTHRLDSIVKEDAWITRNLGRVRCPR